MRFNTLHHIHKMLQNCWRKSFLNTQNPWASGGGFAPRGPLPGQSPGPAGDLKRPPDPSPTFVPLTQNPGSVPGVLKILHWNFSCNWNIFHIQTRNDSFSTSLILHIVQIISLVCKPKCLPLSMARLCALNLILHKIDLYVLFLRIST